VRDKLEKLVTEMVDRGILYEDALQAFERTFLATVLRRNDNNLSHAARELRIHRNTLARKVAELQLKAKPGR
jgi:DNA-binding NtrC family response regulator